MGGRTTLVEDACEGAEGADIGGIPRAEDTMLLPCQMMVSRRHYWGVGKYMPGWGVGDVPGDCRDHKVPPVC